MSAIWNQIRNIVSLRKRAPIPQILIVLAAMGCTSYNAAATDSGPGTYADGHNPAGPPDPGKEAQIWKVDPITGSVSITIPFLNVRPSSRGPFFPYSLQYNSSSTYSLSSNIVPPYGSYDPDSGHTRFSWFPPNTRASGATPAPWVETASPTLYYSSTSVTYTQGQNSYTSGGTSTSCEIVGPMILVDSNGSHDLNLEVTNASGPAIGPCAGGSVKSSSTSDGSSLLTSWGGAATAIYPNGTKFFGNASPGSSSIAVEDSNGNYLTSSGTGSSGTVSDSLGRPLYTITESALTNNAFAHPTAITTYTTGSSVSYALSWGNVPYDFAFPEPTSSNISGNSASFPAEVVPGPGTGTVNVLQSVTFPDNTAYTFTYDPTYGTIQRITFPTGGYVRFIWGIRTFGDINTYASSGMSSLAVTDVYISHGSGEDHWTYNCLNLASNTLTCRVTDPLGNRTDYTGTGYYVDKDSLASGSSPTFLETARVIYNGGTPIRTINTTYNTGAGSTIHPATVTTTLNDAASGTPNQQQVSYIYDQYDNVVEKDESWSGGARKTFTTYYWKQNSAYQTAHIVDKPYSVTVKDGSGTLYSQTLYGYDEYALSGSVGIKNHDDAGFSTAFTGPRGNLTSVRNCIAFSGQNCAGWATTTYHYDLTGQVVSVTDPCGNATCSDMSATTHTTTYSYTDSYQNASPAQQTNGFATTITRPRTGSTDHIDQYSYYYTGNVYQYTDENSEVISYSYTNLATGTADPFNRIGQITFPQTPDGPSGSQSSGYTSYTYSDVPDAFSVTQHTLMSATNSQAITKVTNYDSLGRVVNTQLTSDPEGTVETDTQYDGDGLIYSVSNPYRSTSDPTYGLTSFAYDALGHKTLQTNPDNSSETWSYAGFVVNYTDANSHQWQRTSDGFGRLINIVEPGSLVTTYGYDQLNNMVSVSQYGGTSGSTGARTRSFTYNGLSQLLSAFNPETQTVNYAYDANGNVATRTDARSVTTAYVYDALNRVLSKTYSDAATPSSCYSYDSSSIQNGKGRLAIAWTQSASTTCTTSATVITKRSILGYDAMGRIMGEQQCTPLNCTGTPYSPAYSYDLVGNLTSYTNGLCASLPANGYLFKNAYNSAGRLLSMSRNSCDANQIEMLFTSSSHAAFGGITGAAYGTSLTLSRSYDHRQRIISEVDMGTGHAAATGGSGTVIITGSEQNE